MSGQCCAVEPQRIRSLTRRLTFQILSCRVLATMAVPARITPILNTCWPAEVSYEHRRRADFDTVPAVWTAAAFARFGKPVGRRTDLHSRRGRGLQGGDRRLPAQDCRCLTGQTLANLFFENSTRTRNSFSLAARRLGADTVEFSSSGSSMAKGETVIDTAKNIEAMNVDAVVIRHRTPGTPHLLAKNLELLRSSTPATARTSIRRRGCSTS